MQEFRVFGHTPLKTKDVFGISTDILDASYINRGSLDETLARLLDRNTHIALRGESKCGKSWIRQKNIPDAITIQCRLKKTVRDLYVDALSQLGLQLVTQSTKTEGWKGVLQSSQELGVKILAKLSLSESVEMKREGATVSIPVGRGLDDLRFIAEIIIASGRRLVIEDFHYLSPGERKAFAFDLKALWDYKVYAIVIGIWAENNLLLHLNPDLSGRIEELSIYWSRADLCAVLAKGGAALKIRFSNRVRDRLVEDSFGTVGILQRLTLSMLDEAKIYQGFAAEAEMDNVHAYEGAAMHYADQLNALYQTFAGRVSSGIRQRNNSTGIYAHTLSVIMAADEKSLTDGLHTNFIYTSANAREPRIQKPNLRQILLKIDGIQVDDEGRGLIITYDGNKDEVYVVDKQLFLYRKYATVRWPWENLIDQLGESDASFQGEG